MRTPNVEIDFELGDLVGAVQLTARRKPEQKLKQQCHVRLHWKRLCRRLQICQRDC